MGADDTDMEEEEGGDLSLSVNEWVSKDIRCYQKTVLKLTIVRRSEVDFLSLNTIFLWF